MNKAEFQALIDTHRDRLINSYLPAASKNFDVALKSFQDPPTITKVTRSGELAEVPDEQMRYFGFKASERVLESVGLLTSHAPAILIQQVFNQQQIHVHPVISRLLGEHGQTFDAEFEDEPDPVK